MNFKYFLRGLGVGIVFSAIICLTVYNGNTSKKITDEEVILRAKQLGYVKEDDVVEQKMDQLKDKTSEQDLAKADKDKKAKEDTSKQTEEGKNTSEAKSETVKDEKKKDDKKKDDSDVTTEKKSETTSEVKKETTSENKTEATSKDKSKKTTAEKKEDSNKTEAATTQEKKQENDKKEDKKDAITFTIEPGSSSYPVCLKLKELGLVDNAEEFDTYLVENGYANRISVGEHSLTKGMDYHDIAEAISDPL